MVSNFFLSERPTDQTACVVGLCFSLILLGIFVSLGKFYWFSPDSWLLLDLGSRINFGEYATHIKRSYVPDTYSAPFPAGFPLIISILGASGTLVVVFNVLCFFCTYVVFVKVIEQYVDKFSNATALFCLAPFMYFPYVGEILGARTIPLVVFLVVGSAYLMIPRHQFNQPRYVYSGLNRLFLAGVLLGVALSVRTDSVAVVAALMLMNLYHRKFWESFATGAGLLIGVTPWIVYSSLVFGEIYSSDNSWVTFGFGRFHSQDYYEVLTDKSSVELSNVIESIAGYVSSLLTALIVFSAPLVFLLGRALLKNKKLRFSSFLSLVLLYFSFHALIHSSTGYFNYRYFSLLIVALHALLILESKQITKKTALASICSMMMISALMLTYHLQNRAHLGVFSFECVANHVHNKLEEGVHVFDDSNFASYYAFTRQQNVLLLPFNYSELSQREKASFDEQFRPIKYHSYREDLRDSACGEY